MTQSAKIYIFPRSTTAKTITRVCKQRGIRLVATKKASYTTQPLHPGNDAA